MLAEALQDWMKHMGITHVDMQERMSGSGRLSYRAMSQGLLVGFPVDYRYGWNMANVHHHGLLQQFRRSCKISVTHWAPTCTPWSIASRHKDPKALQAEREAQAPTIRFMNQDIQDSKNQEIQEARKSDF